MNVLKGKNSSKDKKEKKDLKKNHSRNPSITNNHEINLNNENNQFGKDLDQLLELQGQEIPIVVQETILWLEKHALNEEGIFRIPGDKNEIERLKKLYNSDVKAHVNLENEKIISPHSISGLLKLFFRELPQPILMNKHYSAFLKAQRNDDKNALHNMIQELPPSNRELLIYLLKFLNKVSQHSDKNKMTIENLATCWAPNLLRFQGDLEKSMVDINDVNGLISTMIKDVDLFAEKYQMVLMQLTERFEKKLKEINGTIKLDNDKVNESEKDIEKYIRRMNRAKEKTKKYKLNLSLLKKENEEKIINMEQKLKELENQLEKYKNENLELLTINKKIPELQNQLENFQKQHVGTLEELNEKIINNENFQKKIKELEETIKNLSLKEQERLKEIKIFENNLQNKDLKIEELNQEKEKLEKSIKEKEDLIKNKEIELDKLILISLTKNQQQNDLKIQELQHKLDFEIQKKIELQKKIENLELEKMNKEIQSLTKELENLKKQLENDKLLEIEKIKTNYEQQINNLQEEINQLNIQIKDQNKKLQDEIDNLNIKLKLEIEEKESLKYFTGDNKNKIIELEEENNSLKLVILDKEKEIINLSQEIQKNNEKEIQEKKNLQEKLIEIENTLKEQKDIFEKEKKELLTKLETKEQECEELTKKLQEIKENVESINNKWTKEKNEILEECEKDKLSTKIKYEQNLEQLKENQKVLKENFDKTLKKKQQLNKEIEKLKKELQEEIKEKEEKERTIESLEEDIDNLEENEKFLKEEISQKKNKIENLEKELKEKDEKMKNLQNQINEFYNEKKKTKLSQIDNSILKNITCFANISMNETKKMPDIVITVFEFIQKLNILEEENLLLLEEMLDSIKHSYFWSGFDTEMLTFWLSVIISLFKLLFNFIKSKMKYDLKTQIILREFIENPLKEKILCESLDKLDRIFYDFTILASEIDSKLIRSFSKQIIYSITISDLLNDKISSHINDFINLLKEIVQLLKKYYTPNLIISYIIGKVLYVIDCHLFNEFMKHTDYFTSSNGFKIKISISNIDSMIIKLLSKEDISISIIANKQFNFMKEVATFLSMDKSFLNDESTISAIFSTLTITQLKYLVEHFKPDELNPESIPSNIVSSFSTICTKQQQMENKIILGIDPYSSVKQKNIFSLIIDR